MYTPGEGNERGSLVRSRAVTSDSSAGATIYPVVAAGNTCEHVWTCSLLKNQAVLARKAMLVEGAADRQRAAVWRRQLPKIVFLMGAVFLGGANNSFSQPADPFIPTIEAVKQSTSPVACVDEIGEGAYRLKMIWGTAFFISEKGTFLTRRMWFTTSFPKTSQPPECYCSSGSLGDSPIS